MTPVLLDTNQILRIAQPQTPEYPVVTEAIVKYLRAGNALRSAHKTFMSFGA